jgi:hypothetical protein
VRTWNLTDKDSCSINSVGDYLFRRSWAELIRAITQYISHYKKTLFSYSADETAVVWSGVEEDFCWGGGAAPQKETEMAFWNGMEVEADNRVETITIERSARSNNIAIGRHHCTANSGICTTPSVVFKRTPFASLLYQVGTGLSVLLKGEPFCILSLYLFLSLSPSLRIVRFDFSVESSGDIPQEMTSYLKTWLHVLLSPVIYFCDRNVFRQFSFSVYFIDLLSLMLWAL